MSKLSSTLSSFVKSRFTPSCRSDDHIQSPKSKKEQGQGVDEISIPLSTNIYLSYDAVDERYGVHPLIKYERSEDGSGVTVNTNNPNTCTTSGKIDSQVLASANVNTQEMYDSPLYHNMWRIRPTSKSTNHTDGDTTESVQEVLPMDPIHLDSNRFTSFVPNSIILGQTTSTSNGLGNYEGTIHHPIPISARSLNSRSKFFKGCKAKLLSTAIDFTHTDTSIVHSSKEVGQWTLLMDQNRSEDINTVLDNVLDDKTKKILGKLSGDDKYRLERISWTGHGWDDRDNEDDKVTQGRCVSGMMCVDANWVWERIG
ncbi:hypothetical protein I203_105697 [Kwoniella mangroviensis CBS 8507]|uniref:uncharacterized protein n=1 Tax=Kwoniella mangroviensis CBS 8507 TaxID=1296122 RepID=UPI00080D10F3|nr:uncharacterized protein I203_01509 [Kwoniella mangroviensis CBS 8507]OCF69645.1 hypothetical protein I203_01509 [Kwoniella mangroviensis CBS 8507]